MRNALPLITLSLLLLALPLRAADPPQHTISTSGNAVIYVTPDQVMVTFAITTTDAQPTLAKSENDEAAARLLKAIKSLGIDEKDIATDSLNLSIEYKDGRVASGIAAYSARRAYAVKLKDPKLTEKLIELGVQNGANELVNIDPQTTQLRKYRDEARAMAIKAAKEKAQLLAKELESSVGKAITISEGSSDARSYQNPYLNISRATEDPDPITGTIPLGQIPVSANVSVTFELKN